MPEQEHPITIIGASFRSDEEIEINFVDANRNRSSKVVEVTSILFPSTTATGALLAAIDALRDLVDAVQEEGREPAPSFQRMERRR